MTKPDEILDLSGVTCPANASRALLRLESMASGSVLKLVVDDGEPIALVPEAVAEEGHEVLSREKRGNQWQLLVRAE